MSSYPCKSCKAQQVFVYPVSTDGGTDLPANVGSVPAAAPSFFRRKSFWEGVAASLFATMVVLVITALLAAEAVRSVIKKEVQRSFETIHSQETTGGE